MLFFLMLKSSIHGLVSRFLCKINPPTSILHNLKSNHCTAENLDSKEAADISCTFFAKLTLKI